MILDNVNMPKDIKALSTQQLTLLSEEIRKFLIDNLSKTGGHLASNLGVVELTIALHKVFNAPKDKLIWDVGHQTYVHKILTGRKNEFGSLRKLNGLSGFPKTEESPFDVFNTGHSSTSVSAGLGIARARDIRGENYSVVSIIGDGALTGGMAFEALNDAGRSPTDMIVILNDNEMSIDKNVGAMSKYLDKIRLVPTYSKVKDEVEDILNRIPKVGKPIKDLISKTKDGIKYIIGAGALFEELGFNYFGPIDGHNMDELISTLEKIKSTKGPVLLHVITQKGKGYEYAEKRPHLYHGISPFDIETGLTIQEAKQKDYSKVFGDELVKLARDNENIVAITAAMPSGTCLDKFAAEFPDRFFDVGIAEQHAVTLAAGLASQGLKPVVAIYSSFLQRAYDQIIHDVALQNLPVVFAIDRAGLVGSDGETHQGIFDLSFLSHIPNMTVLSPKDYSEFRRMINFAINLNSPVAIRYPRGVGKESLGNKEPIISLGKSEKIYGGNDVTIVALGNMVEMGIEVSRGLLKNGIYADLINARFVKPLDKKAILDSINKTGYVVTIEDNLLVGGLATQVKDLICNMNNIKIECYGYNDRFIKQGSVRELYELEGITIKNIMKNIMKNTVGANCVRQRTCNTRPYSNEFVGNY